MKRLTISNIEVPEVYLCEDGIEARRCRELGVPFIVRPHGMGDRVLVIMLMYPYLREKFPSIDWERAVTGRRGGGRVGKDTSPSVNVIVPCTERIVGERGRGSASSSLTVVEDGYRVREGGEDAGSGGDEAIPITEFAPTDGWHVSIEELQALHVLPVFLSDIADAIKSNLMGIGWMDGWNKKLGAPLGSWSGGDQARNLIILDTSASVPAGVSGTMVTLAETLRAQADADFIITSHHSAYFRREEKLPSAEELAYYIGGANEVAGFTRILEENVLGRKWGNVIVFGDDDAPSDGRFCADDVVRYDGLLVGKGIGGTQIGNLMCFHTSKPRVPGYGLWALKVDPTLEHRMAPVNCQWARWFQ